MGEVKYNMLTKIHSKENSIKAIVLKLKLNILMEINIVVNCRDFFIMGMAY